MDRAYQSFRERKSYKFMRIMMTNKMLCGIITAGGHYAKNLNCPRRYANQSFAPCGSDDYTTTCGYGIMTAWNSLSLSYR